MLGRGVKEMNASAIGPDLLTGNNLCKSIRGFYSEHLDKGPREMRLV